MITNFIRDITCTSMYHCSEKKSSAAAACIKKANLHLSHLSLP